MKSIIGSNARRSTRKYLEFTVRRFTSAIRKLPDFIILGAQKAGTTTLYSYLSSHPEVRPAFVKEVHYFTMHYSRGEYWYRSHFPVNLPNWTIMGRTITGEASPYYLAFPPAISRINSDLQSCRFIVLLRDPVERALSHFRHNVSKGRERRSFEEAIIEDLELARNGVEITGDESNSDWVRRTSYVRRGLYAQQLVKWFDSTDRNRFLILDYHRFFADAGREMRSVYRFLGVKDTHDAGTYVCNTGKSIDIKSSALLSELKQFFKIPNQHLEELLHRKFLFA